MSRFGVYVGSKEAKTPRRQDVGGKGLALFRVRALAGKGGFDVPPFIVIDPVEARNVARGEDHALSIVRIALAVENIHGPVAVRSSAVEEDGVLRSYAGLFTSMLNVPLTRSGAELCDAVRRVVESAGSAHAAAYRAHGGEAPDADRLPGMAVVVQAQLDPAVAGVAFSADPLGGRNDVAVVSAVYGLGEGLVSGELEADTWRVPARPDKPLEATIAEKPRAIRSAPAGGVIVTTTAEQAAALPSLADDEVRRVAACARFLARRLGSPQDVEWALAGDARRLHVLQARPITARGSARRLWDNSNIVESYAGVTTPLTFAFARSAYETVYRQFCAVMGVPQATIEANADVFANLLGLLRGRIYYELRNWYRMLALLPGFAFNRGFMETMMGVREPLAETVTPPGAMERTRDLLRLLRMVATMIVEERRLDGRVPAFHARVERALAPLAEADLAALPPAELVALYQRLERELLHQWKTPIVNDFFAMVFFGTLSKLTPRWLPGEPPTLVNDLLCGEGGIVSTEPARRLMDLARRVVSDPALAARFDALSDDRALWNDLSARPEGTAFMAELRAYVRRFGDRCMEELKLETVTLAEDPLPLLATVRAYRSARRIDPEAALERERAIRRTAEARIAARLGGLRRIVFRFVLSRARRRVRDRENLRFERTRVFGVVRRIFVALGHHLAAHGVLREARDVFYLTPAEVFARIEGAMGIADPAAAVAERKARFERFRQAPAPPDRFETVGPPDAWLDRHEETPQATPTGEIAGALSGTGACPGVVRAPVRVVTDPRGVTDLGGRILVAERTDPGWTLLFPVAAGLLVERGSLLSHSAIVAREIGLPCIVGVRGLLATVKNGDEIEMDGTSGAIRLVAKAEVA